MKKCIKCDICGSLYELYERSRGDAFINTYHSDHIRIQLIDHHDGSTTTITKQVCPVCAARAKHDIEETKKETANE